MILIAFRNGLRAAELCDLRSDQIDLDGALLHVRRVKNGCLAARHKLPAIFVHDTALNLTDIP